MPAIPFTCVSPGVWAVTASTAGQAPYIVRDLGTHWTCECKSWMYSKEPVQTCKHCRAIQAALALPAPAAPVRYCAVCGLNPVTDGLERCAGCAASAAKARRSRVKVRHDSVVRVIDTTPLVVDETALRERLDWEYAERQRLEALNQRIAETVFGR
jgi:hypothetical protein